MQFAGEGAETTYWLRITLWRHGDEVSRRPQIDAGGIGMHDRTNPGGTGLAFGMGGF